MRHLLISLLLFGIYIPEMNKNICSKFFIGEIFQNGNVHHVVGCLPSSKKNTKSNWEWRPMNFWEKDYWEKYKKEGV